MSAVSVTVQIPKEIAADLRRAAQARRTVTEGAAMGVEAALREHFATLQRAPRKDGLRPVGFWSGVDGNSVAEQISGHVIHDDGRASVEIDSAPLRHKLDGGTVAAADYGHKYLTIPATDAAARAPQGARSFSSHIEWVAHPDGGVRPALVAGGKRAKAGGKRAKAGGKRAKAGAARVTAGAVLFWLVRSVTHEPMPEALPGAEALADAARDAALDALDALLASEGAA